MQNIEYLVYIVIGVIVVIGGMTFSSVSAGKKLKHRLTGSFGKEPDDLEYGLGSIAHYHFYKQSHVRDKHYIDDITWSDLDMDKVFKRINVCLTSVGEEYLYACLHEPQFEQTELFEREHFIAYLAAHPEERLRLQEYLAKTGKQNHNGVSSFIYNANEKMLKYTWLYKVFAVIPILCIITMCINISIGAVCLVASFLTNLAVYYLTKRKIEFALSSIQYFSSMLWCCTPSSYCTLWILMTLL